MKVQKRVLGFLTTGYIAMCCLTEHLNDLGVFATFGVKSSRITNNKLIPIEPKWLKKAADKLIISSAL